MKRPERRAIAIAFCAVLVEIATGMLFAQSAAQSAAVEDLRHPQPAQLPVAGLTVIPEDLSRVLLADGYLLNVQVFGAPDVSGTYAVDSLGDLTLPLVGKMHVAGMATQAAQDKIAAALKSGGFILSPSVTLTVQGYVPTYVTIAGEVQMPGQYPLLAPHSIQQVLALAGGTTLFASGSLEIKRKVGGEEKTIDLAIRGSSGGDNATVLPGDQVTVKRAGLVYVLGGVYRPGGYIMQENGQLDVVQAIALASGTTLQAAIRSIRVVRRNPDGSVVEIPVNYRAMVDGKLSPMVLRAQDVVYVPVSKAKAALGGGAASALGATSAAAIYVAH